MYNPKAFRVSQDAAIEMMRSAPFAHLVTSGPDGFDAVSVPVLVDETPDGLSLRCHVARANPVWRRAPCPALALFPLDDAYVSPSWYPSKAEHAEVVPTWNYEIVHVHGRLVVHDDSQWTATVVRRLTDRHESTMTEPWSVDDAPAAFTDAQLRAIVGLELHVERMEAKRKLSQNRSEADRQGVIDGLGAMGSEAAAVVADAMRRPLG